MEAERLGMEIESVAFKAGTLAVLARGGLDELQALNQALSGFLDSAGEHHLLQRARALLYSFSASSSKPLSDQHSCCPTCILFFSS